MSENKSADMPTLVNQALQMVDLSVSHQDRSWLIEVYPEIRRLVQQLRRPEISYTGPVTVFRPGQPEV